MWPKPLKNRDDPSRGEIPITSFSLTVLMDLTFLKILWFFFEPSSFFTRGKNCVSLDDVQVVTRSGHFVLPRDCRLLMANNEYSCR